MADRITLLSNASATGSAVYIPVRGQYLLTVAGTFSGATVKVQILAGDNSTYVDVASSSLTAAGTALISLPAGGMVKANVASGTPSGLYATLDLVVQ